MLGVINFIIGIALAAGEAFINPALKGAAFIKNLGVDLLGASSEFVGDATQGFIGKVADKIKEHKEQKRLKDFINRNLTNIQDENNTFHKIIQEIKNHQNEEEFERKGRRKSVHKVSNSETDILKKDDIRAIMQMSTDLLFTNNITDYLIAYSFTFRELQERDVKSAEDFVQLIKITVNVYVKDLFYNSKDDFKVLAYVIVNALEERNKFCFTEKGYEELSDKLIQKLLPYLANQNGGVIDFQAVANAKYEPKYIKNACPGCGYDGDRLLVNEKTGTISCAACGKSYDLVQYAEPELYEKMEVKLQELNQKRIEEYNQLNIKLNDRLYQLEQNNQSTSENLMIAIEDLKKEHGKLIGDNFKKVLADCETLKDDTKKLKTKMESLSSLCKSLGKDKGEIQKQFAEQCKLGVTKEYLDACLKGQTEQFSEKIESLIDDKFNAVTDSVFSNLQQGQQEILDFLKKKTEEDRQVVGHFSQKLDSLDKQVNSLYEYAKEMFPELSGKSDLILEYVQKLCSKEYYEEMSNALGTDINKAISMEMKNGYEHIQALNSTSVSQIISAIEDLKKDCAKEGGVDQKIIEDSIRNANVQLSGQISGLQSLVERNQELISAKIKEGNEKTLSLLRIIIKGQEEQTAIMLANAGLKMDRHDFEKIYQGRIPSKYLINRGLPGPFPCPYCGVVEERPMNEEQYCRCSVCGNYFLKVDPFQHDIDNRKYEDVLKEDFGHDENEEWFATKEKIKQWRKAHTVRWKNNIVNTPSYLSELTDIKMRHDIIIFPNDFDIKLNQCNFYAVCESTEIIILSNKVAIENAKDFNDNEKFVFKDFRNLRKIVLIPNSKGQYESTINKIAVANYGVKIYGKNAYNKEISVEVKQL